MGNDKMQFSFYIQTEMFSTFNTATEIWNSYAVQGRL